MTDVETTSFEALDRNGFTSIDAHFADMLCRKGKHTDSQLHLTLMHLSQAMGNQHSCLKISDPEILAKLKQSRLVTEVALGDSLQPSILQPSMLPTPLVLLWLGSDQALLYTNRFFCYETRIAVDLMARNAPLPDAKKNLAALTDLLDPADDPLQILAAAQTVSQRLSIITGGPGTGKTSTVAKILGALSQANPSLRIKLAAPTGKAAMRLAESINAASLRLQLNIPFEVSTLHRMLGMRSDGNTFTHHKRNPLPLDVIILDESSMIDLVMFDRFIAALEPDTQLILLGDPAQLPSVDSGAVLGDLTQQGMVFNQSFRDRMSSLLTEPLPESAESHPLVNCHCMLKTSFRFKDDSGIGAISRALRDGTEAFESNDEVNLVQQFDQPDVLKKMNHMYQAFLAACHDSEVSPEQLIETFDQARVLTPVREGELGVIELNERFEQQHFPNADTYYHGKPVMIMRNHYALRLFNGDIGICVQRGDKIEIAFRKPDGELEFYLPARLPQHETCYAMTVHKSQGSEFDQVLLVLPISQQENFISRELVYTGVTRCKQSLSIYSHQDIFTRPSEQRTTGLSLRLKALCEDIEATHADEKASRASGNELAPGSSTNASDNNQQLDLFQ